MSWLSSLLTKFKKVPSMSSDTADSIAQPSETDLYTAAAVSSNTAAVAVPTSTPYVATTDVDVVLATLKTLLITAGYSIPVYDQLASAAKVLGTK